MNDDMNDDIEYYADFQDVVAQRAIAFCRLAQVTAAIKDERVHELCLTMMRKVCASIKTPSTGEVRLITDVETDAGAAH